ncbi:hypothetical protein [Desulfohalovibrio reitneri]|uniref:hypothetical protein n=1 Tax=Desulfohalovibrio reitneri TaxID=1307759 RepID=UPI00068DE86F|nr:hypothetical protein [Desulfohalovibrio reitneri]
MAANKPGRTASLFEFWPPWLFYAPVAAWCCLLALRHRGATLPALADPLVTPLGGLVGESKAAILDMVRGEARKLLLPYALVDLPDASPTRRLDRCLAAMDLAGLDFPVVAKPDVGERGAGVRPVASETELADYLGDFPGEPGRGLLLQRLSSHPGEAGVFWARPPGAERGYLLSITGKEFPCVTGDGRDTLETLIRAHPRFKAAGPIYLERFAGRLDDVPGEGERVPLVFAGNHCRGAVFRDAADLATPELLLAVEGICSSMEEFHFGRVDVRAPDRESLARGENLEVVEINALGSEATHVWDPDMSLPRAWRDLCRQWSLAWEIGAANRDRGFRAPPLLPSLRGIFSALRGRPTCPPTR